MQRFIAMLRRELLSLGQAETPRSAFPGHTHRWVFQALAAKSPPHDARCRPDIYFNEVVRAIAETFQEKPPEAWRAKICGMYAQKFLVEVVVRGERRACPLEWLDQFCMRNFTNSADFDDTLPVAEGQVEASFRLTPERFAEGLGAWLTQRGKGEGQPVKVEVRRENP